MNFERSQLLIFLLLNQCLFAFDSYLYKTLTPSHSSWGTTGVLNMPSARFHKEGSLALNLSNHNPYTRLSLSAYPFPWFEGTYQYTDMRDRLYSEVFAFSRNQTFKDKGFDIKFRALKETNLLPQIAVGFRDLAGTSLFSSEYIVLSKYINNFDFSLGVGWGTYSNGNFKNPFRLLSSKFNSRGTYDGDNSKGGELTTSAFFRGPSVGIFGGIEYFSSRFKGLRYKLEYDSTNYNDLNLPREGDASQDLSSRFNYGITYFLNDAFNINFGYVRGNTIQFGFILRRSFGKKSPLADKNSKPITYDNSKVIQEATAIERRLLYLASLRYLKDDDINLRSANIQKDKLSIAYSQSKFTNYPQSYGRVLQILDQISPEYITNFELIPQNRVFSLAKITVNRDDWVHAKTFKDSPYLINKIGIENTKITKESHEYSPSISYPALFWDIGPDYSSHIGGADRFFAGSLDLNLNFEAVFNESLNLQFKARQPIYSTFNVLTQQSDSKLPHVRTDIVNYMTETDSNLSIQRAQLNYFNHFSKEIYFKVSMGILEYMFGGIGMEYLFRPVNSNIAIGLEAFHVKQREFDQRFNFQKYSTNTGHLTLYVTEPKTDLLLRIIGGRYLAEDSGFTFDLSRRFESGLYMGAFFTLTDISKEEFGEGTFDKGFYFNMPIDTFIGNYSRKRSGFALRPLTRDGGQRITHGYTLYGLTDESDLNNIYFGKHDFFN